MLFREAFEKAKIGQFIKTRGDSFHGPVEHYQKTGLHSVDWSTGSVGGPVSPKEFERLLASTTIAYYEVYSRQNDHALVTESFETVSADQKTPASQAQWIEGQPPTDPRFRVRAPVATIFDLPTVGNEINDCRLVIAHRKYHYWVVY